MYKKLVFTILTSSLLFFGISMADSYKHYDEDYKHHKYHNNHNKGYYKNNSGEDMCDKAYECLDECPTSMYRKCLEKCLEKYPCEELDY